VHPEASGSDSSSARSNLKNFHDTVRANSFCGVTAVRVCRRASFLVLAGLGAGLVGSIAGLASLISYPALLAIGLPPVIANVTNTVALVFSSGGSVLGSRPELGGQSTRLRRLGAVAVLGGVMGGLLLLITPPGAFERIVPWLIAFASMAILVHRRPQEVQSGDRRGDAIGLSVGVFLVAVYGGYFGAAAGVLMLALLLASTRESLARSNAVKNVVLGLANAMAAVIFIFFGSVQWSVVAPLALRLPRGGAARSCRGASRARSTPPHRDSGGWDRTRDSPRDRCLPLTSSGGASLATSYLTGRLLTTCHERACGYARHRWSRAPTGWRRRAGGHRPPRRWRGPAPPSVRPGSPR